MVELIKNGEYLNIPLKTKYEWDHSKKQFKFNAEGDKIVKQKGMEPNESIIVTKKFADGRAVEGKYGTTYSAAVTYNGQEATFWLDEYEHQKYAVLGGVDDKVKITLKVEEKLNKKLGVKVPVQVLYFEKVE